MNRKIRKPVRRNVRGLREGVNTFKKRHLLREAPDDIEYSVEEAGWEEECDTWEEAQDKLRTLVTPEEYKQLMKFYTVDMQVIDIILYNILKGYEYTPALFKWVIENVRSGRIDWGRVDGIDPETLFDALDFSTEDFPRYSVYFGFDYEDWCDDFKKGLLDPYATGGYRVYKSDEGGEYIIREDLLLRDVSDFVFAWIDDLMSSL